MIEIYELLQNQFLQLEEDKENLQKEIKICKANIKTYEKIRNLVIKVNGDSTEQINKIKDETEEIEKITNELNKIRLKRKNLNKMIILIEEVM